MADCSIASVVVRYASYALLMQVPDQRGSLHGDVV
jgi:hypothetical protein